jgi:hypothetical protein
LRAASRPGIFSGGLGELLHCSKIFFLTNYKYVQTPYFHGRRTSSSIRNFLRSSKADSTDLDNLLILYSCS